MCSKNILFFYPWFLGGLPQNLGFDFSVRHLLDQLPSIQGLFRSRLCKRYRFGVDRGPRSVRLTALIPESCCESCIMIPMRSGCRSVGEQMSSDMEMDASADWARSSARISSMSSSTCEDARSRCRAATPGPGHTLKNFVANLRHFFVQS